MSRLRHIIEHLEEVYIATLLAVMVAISFAEVVARYVFNYSFTMAHEAVGLCFAWLIFVGMSYGVRTKAHIGVDAFVKKLPPIGQKTAGIIVAVLCIIYSGIIVYGGYLYVEKIYSIGIYLQDVPIKKWIPLIVLPLGFALLGYRFLEVFYKLITGKETDMLADETKDALKLKTD